MIGDTSKTDPTVIIGTFAFTRTKTPKPVADAHDAMAKLRKASFGATRGGLGDAVAAAILADRDPAADPDVQRAITATYIDNPGMTQHLEHVAAQGFRDACTRHHEAIVTLWQEPYAKTADALAEAHTRLNGVALDDTTGILAQGGDSADVWAQAQKDHRTLDRIAQGWTALMSVIGANIDQRHRLLRIADVSATDWVTRGLAGQHATPWDALSAGLTLSLPTLAEYRARVAEIEAMAAADAAQQSAGDPEREATKAWARKLARVQ